MESLSGPFAILVLVLDILAIVQVWRSSIEMGRKVIWSLVIVLLPVVGLIMWAVAAGPFGKARL
ncbi:PLDc N-terminal domain-containing protein [Pseudomonas sp. SCT]|uniref:PLDc N-terminal domain-containing protein n=1 Tax=Pseudomonas sp. (strain SCT) TaxID=412955 RepID=UPI000F61AC71|nr:PLDc N-terminal domain-containing protein [Pseudomonas sp. SCT]